MTRPRTAARAGFRQALAHEWIKYRSLRSTLWITGAIALVPVAGAVFVAATTSLQPDDTVLGGSLTLAVVAEILAAVVGALLISGEYSSGTIRSTLTACPRRGTVLAAKALLIAALMSGLALVSATAAYWVGRGMLPRGQYAPGEPMPALLGVAGSFAVAGLLGLAIGTLVRHPAGAVTTVIAVILLPDLLAPLFGDAQRWIAGISPTAALQKLSQSSDATAETVGSLGPWPSLWLVCGYTAAALLAAGWLLRHRDA